MSEELTKYEKLGVSSSKSEVHEAIKDLSKGIFPNAFCKILPDPLDKNMCTIMHADTAGTKVILAYILWKETGSLEGFKTIGEDALVMNLDDMAAVGITDYITVSSTIGRNKHLITGEVIACLIQSTDDYLKSFKPYGINLINAGGETADVGDIVRTLDVGFTMSARVPRSEILENNIKDGDHVLGLSSSGKTTYDSRPNSGMGSNGLTSGRHDVLSHIYADKYPEIYAAECVGMGDFTKDIIYSGTHKIIDRLPQLMMNPTRTHLQYVKALKDKNIFYELSGVIHNTGGGHSKVKNFVKNLHIKKEFSSSLPEVFSSLATASNTSWQEMFGVYNMGCRYELYGPKDVLDEAAKIAKSMGLEPVMTGTVSTSDKTLVEISHQCSDENIIL